MTTAITNRRIGIIGNRFRMPKKNPTQEQLLTIAPTCNMMFALSMVLEGYSLELKEGQIWELACLMRSKINEYTPDVAEEFGNWADSVEFEIVQLPFKNRDVMNWLISKIYALACDMTKMYRLYDSAFVFEQENTVNELKMRQKNFNPKIVKELNEIVKRIIES